MHGSNTPLSSLSLTTTAFTRQMAERVNSTLFHWKDQFYQEIKPNSAARIWNEGWGAINPWQKCSNTHSLLILSSIHSPGNISSQSQKKSKPFEANIPVCLCIREETLAKISGFSTTFGAAIRIIWINYYILKFILLRCKNLARKFLLSCFPS